VKNTLGQRQLPFLEKALAGKDYVLGQFSVADGYLFTVSRASLLSRRRCRREDV
jgi:glutathione S-transferase